MLSVSLIMILCYSGSNILVFSLKLHLVSAAYGFRQGEAAPPSQYLITRFSCFVRQTSLCQGPGGGWASLSVKPLENIICFLIFFFDPFTFIPNDSLIEMSFLSVFPSPKGRVQFCFSKIHWIGLRTFYLKHLLQMPSFKRFKTSSEATSPISSPHPHCLP